MQAPQNYPPVSLNMPFESQEPYYYPTYTSHYLYHPHPQPVYRTTLNHSRPRPNYPNTPTTPFHISLPNFQTQPRPSYNPRPIQPHNQI